MSSKQVIKTNLYTSKAPLEWAIMANNVLYTAQIPIDHEGNIIKGGIEHQSKQVLDNLLHTLKSANLTTEDVLQVLVYVTKREDLHVFNEVYVNYFNPPYPTRAALIISGLAREEMLIELVVYAQGRNHE